MSKQLKAKDAELAEVAAQHEISNRDLQVNIISKNEASEAQKRLEDELAQSKKKIEEYEIERNLKDEDIKKYEKKKELSQRILKQIKDKEFDYSSINQKLVEKEKELEITTEKYKSKESEQILANKLLT